MEKQSIAFLDFRADPPANPLKTPLGKIEIYSEALTKLTEIWTLPEGDRIPPIPEFCIVHESHLNTSMTAKYPLQLSGFHTKGTHHSPYSNVQFLHKAAPDEVRINPIDAAACQLKSSDRVRVFND
ncbi:MAG: molybdopterin dinucleotide binding domain-containing protein [Candidatus Malihini olakiniferum]